MKTKRVFSGIQPSGNLHIGNYFGAILTWVREQDQKENIFCIVDEHAITVPQDPKKLKQKILELAKIYVAAGINPKKCTIFVQSSRPEHAELAWLLNCNARMGELSRMTQFKDKSGKGGDSVSVGLFDYPVLMAADILLYAVDEIPVGEDQKQHVELARNLGERFNNKYGNTFTIPEYYTVKEATRIMSLTDPTKKMSKSDENSNSRIEILDEPETIRKKFARATTDSGTEIKFDKENKPGISNLLNILSVCTQKSIPELEKEYKGKNYGEFKSAVADAVIALLIPVQEKYAKIKDAEIKRILESGAKKIGPLAQKTLQNTKDKIGLGL